MKLPFYSLQTFNLALLASASLTAQAYDEIQVYDMGINNPGQYALEMHSNYAIKGRQRPDYPGELPPDGQLAFTAEFSYGWSKQIELGLYVPMSIDPINGNTFLDDAKLRVKWLNTDNPSFFYGLNTEIGLVPKRYSEQPVGMEIRPIMGHYADGWLLAFNPSLELDLTGNSQMPVLSPGLKITHETIDNLYLGFEHYADFGPLSGFASGSNQGHTTYLVGDLSHGNYRLHVGIGHGWTEPSDEWMLKCILGGIPFMDLLNPRRW